jgi:arsenate reductase (thioredoxin)
MDRPCRVLFISRRNSARSLMAETIVNRHGKGKFIASSAGIEPSQDADPVALSVLEQAGYSTTNLRPKHWRKFAGSAAPILDFVFYLERDGFERGLSRVARQAGIRTMAVR